MIIAPSILACDLAHLQEEVDSIAPYAEWIQVDVMDGHFVPNLSFGAPVIACLKTPLLLDAHLMVQNPGQRIAEFLKAGCRNITFHAEAVTRTADRTALIEAIHTGGATAGIALNPDTPVSAIADIIDAVDLVLVMSVFPGFGGQTFLPHVLEKVAEIRAAHPSLMIQIDGGMTAQTAREARQAGVTNIVAGSFIFKASDRAQAIQSLRT